MKHEDVTAEGINFQRRLRHGPKAIEAAPHIFVTGYLSDTGADGQADHFGDPRPRCSNSRSTVPGTVGSGQACRE